MRLLFLLCTVGVFVLVGILPQPTLFAAEGDTIKVSAYSGIRFYNSTRGQSNDTTALFPSNKKYARIVMNLKLSCPCGVLKGEWDYTNKYFVKRNTGKLDSLNKPIYENIEIARFITPYWKYKPANNNYTWKWDVTDYAYLLKDTVRLLTTYEGYSESALFDVWFDCIEGTPPYEVTEIQKLWEGYFPYGKASDPIDNYTVGKKFKLRNDAKYVKLRIYNTGHGGGGDDNAAEFADKTHKIWIEGKERFTQHLWREDCGLNPVYPQDGTWPIQRAGWCPGDVVQYWDWDVTSMISKTDSTSIDYKMQPFTNSKYNSNPSGYGVNGQIHYSPGPNFTYDVSIQDLIAPNNATPYNRTNPICGNPVVRIRNNGKTVADAVTFEYGVRGETPQTFTWNGNLDFMQEQVITLPPVDFSNAFKATTRIFDIKVTKVNDKPDEYPLFNSASATFNTTPKYGNTFVVNMRTNKEVRGQGYYWEVVNTDGITVAAKRNGDLSDDTQYSDTLTLADGCYEFKWVNPSSYGLSWWATQNSLGGGVLTLSDGNKTVVAFNGDCGNMLYHQFRAGLQPKIQVARDTVRFGVIPVGDSVRQTIKIRAANKEGLEISKVDVSAVLPSAKGFSIVSVTPSIPQNGTLFLDYNKGDELTVVVQLKPDKTGKKSTNLAITSNDAVENTVYIPLLGGLPGTSGVDDELQPENIHIAVAPSVSSAESVVTFSLDITAPTNARCEIYNTVGQFISTLYNDTVHPGAQQTARIQTSSLAQGMYFIAVRCGNTVRQIPFAVVK